MLKKCLHFYEENKKWGPLSFFLGGFFLDVLTLGNADEFFTNVQLSLFLLLAASLIYLEVLVLSESLHFKGIWAKAWRFHKEATQFLLGTLFSAYTVFYFQSASIRASFAFLAVLVIVMLINEFVDFGFKGMGARLLFFVYCLVSFFVYFTPVVLKSVGPFVFLAALIAASLVYWGYYTLVKKKLGEKHKELLGKVFRVPFLAVLLFFLVTYYSKAIPPVPLSVNYIGVFHKVERENEKYRLLYKRPSWKFWQKGAQSFLAQKGDRIYCFFSIYSPVDFSDRVYIRWSFKNSRGDWERSDAIPIQIFGGRGEGYRGYTYKQNYQAGEWRVEVETEDERELGRIYFEVSQSDETSAREWDVIFK